MPYFKTPSLYNEATLTCVTSGLSRPSDSLLSPEQQQKQAGRPEERSASVRTNCPQYNLTLCMSAHDINSM